MSLSPAVPNPPGPIDILTKTTSSIGMRWTEAPRMTGISFEYWLTITSPGEEIYIPGNNTSYTFSYLLSGTSYNMSVATVGALGFKSEGSEIFMVTTSKGLYFCTLKNVKAEALFHFYCHVTFTSLELLLTNKQDHSASRVSVLQQKRRVSQSCGLNLTSTSKATTSM